MLTHSKLCPHPRTAAFTTGLLVIAATFTTTGTAQTPEPSLRMLVWARSSEEDATLDRALEAFRQTGGVRVELTRVTPSLEEAERAKRDALDALDRALGAERRERVRDALTQPSGPPAEYEALLLASLQSREPADLFLVTAELLPRLIATRRLVSLDELLAQHPDAFRDLAPRGLFPFRISGQLYAVPFSADETGASVAFAIARTANTPLAFNLLSFLYTHAARQPAAPGVTGQPDDTSRQGFGRTRYPTATEAPAELWQLGGNARLDNRARDRQILVARGDTATWRDAAAEDYTLTFRCRLGRGRALVNLQSSGGAGRAQAYQLSIERARIALVRLQEGPELPLAATRVQIDPDRWFDVAVYKTGAATRVSLDNETVLEIRDEVPLPPGELTFSTGSDSQEVAYAEVGLTPWSRDQASELAELLERTEPPSPPAAALPEFPGARLPGNAVPLSIKPYKHPANSPLPAYPIRLGEVPPNYVHSWVIDTKGFTRFNFYSLETADIELGKGDRVTFFSEASLSSDPPVPLAVIEATSTADQMHVDITSVASLPGSTTRRLFLQLETSDVAANRRFELRALVNLDPNDGDEEILVLDDDLSYQHGTIALGNDIYGQPWAIPAPWYVGVHTNYNNYPIPKADDGWHLIGRNLTDPTPHFYFLAYYNEQRSLLRLFLLNLDMPMNVSGGTVTLSLLRLEQQTVPATGETYLAPVPLQGALFPLHPNPNRWSQVTVPLVDWKMGSWACIEVPMLYPMAQNVPIDPHQPAPQPSHYYRSLYEEPLQKGYRNIQLRIDIDTYDYATLDATLEGKAVGEAIQKLTSSGGFSLIDFAKQAASAGGDIYSGAKKVYNAVTDYFDALKKAKPGDSALKTLGNIVSMGVGVFSGGFSAAGAAFSFITSLFGGNAAQPLQLSIELDIMGSVTGSFKCQHTWGSSSRFYLPGRFSVAEAGLQKAPLDDDAALAAIVPRHDRILGLFGYRYNPGLLTVRVLRWNSKEPPKYVFPATQNPDPNVLLSGGFHPQYGFRDWYKYAAPSLDRALPVIYNPYAEIVPLTPSVVQTGSYEDPLRTQGWFLFAPAHWFTRYRWYFDVAWANHVSPLPGDASFPHNVAGLVTDTVNRMFLKVYTGRVIFPPVSTIWDYSGDFPDGMLLQVEPNAGYVPRTYKQFVEIKDLPVRHWYECTLDNLKDGKAAAFDAADPFPVQDVLYCWEVHYYYYGRSRQKADGSVPRFAGNFHFRSPLTLDLWVCEFDGLGGALPVQHYAVKSRLLVQ
ncbi:MAG: hypothetical protein AB1486_19315 [Planctomycetota bacterium]